MGYKQKKDVPPMEREINYLLADLCVFWGFCISSEEMIKISKTEFYYARDFAKDVIEAEGMNAEYENKWVNKISAKFRERFGEDEISISTFVDRVRGHKENW
ncbi:MAG: hypothetical protein AB8H03_15055 [Saprospiraceae bacterium]